MWIVALNNGDVELRPVLQVSGYVFGDYLEGGYFWFVLWSAFVFEECNEVWDRLSGRCLRFKKSTYVAKSTYIVLVLIFSEGFWFPG